jgi:hypothetical protein
MPSLDFKLVASFFAVIAIAVAAAASGETTDTGSPSSSAQDSASNSKPKLTPSQENAVKAASSYLELSGFSKKGLISQLSSSAGDGYPKKDAKFAVKYLDPNWNAEAVQAAKEYLDTSAFSCQGMIDQLSSSSGSGFTTKQAEHAANKVGLC